MDGRLIIGPDGSEQVQYDTPELPVHGFSARLSELYNYAAGCHWHNGFEFLIADRGEMEYFVNGRILRLRQGEGIFVNANRMHYGFSSEKRECLYSCLVFHPSMLGQLHLPMARYALSFSQDDRADYLLLRPGDPLGKQILDLIHQAIGVGEEQKPLYELELQGICGKLLASLWKLEGGGENRADPAWAALRQMTGFIQDHHQEPIRLEQIAAAGAVCRSKCCRLFRERMGTSPIGYLNDYRLDKAAALLRQTALPITEIASHCGFDSPSYFSEAYRKRFGISPRQSRVQ